MKTLILKHKRSILFALFAVIMAAFSLPLFTIPAMAAKAVTGLKLATIPSTFTCADLLVSQAKAEQIWIDNAQNADYIPYADAVVAIAENQTAKLDPIVGKQDKDNTLKIVWLTDCELEVQDETTACFPDGPDSTSNCKTYEPTFAIEVPFKITEETLRTSIYSKEEVLARKMLMAIKKIEENIAAKAVAFLEDSEGVNAYAGLGTIAGGGTVGNSYTKIAPGLWNAGLNGYFTLAAKQNKYASPYLLSGTNLFLANWNAEAEAANADGKGNLNKFRALKQYWDTFNVDGAFANPSSFLLDRSAVAFGAKWKNEERPIDHGGEVGTRYSIPSKILPNTRYDVFHKLTCVNKEIVHHFVIVAKGGFYLNPTGCVETKTGILRFSNEA